MQWETNLYEDWQLNSVAHKASVGAQHLPIKFMERSSVLTLHINFFLNYVGNVQSNRKSENQAWIYLHMPLNHNVQIAPLQQTLEMAGWQWTVLLSCL